VLEIITSRHYTRENGSMHARTKMEIFIHYILVKTESFSDHFRPGKNTKKTAFWEATLCRLCLKCDGTCAETRFRLRWNGRVRLNQWGRQFSRLLAAEVCASAVVMLDTPYFKVCHPHCVYKLDTQLITFIVAPCCMESQQTAHTPFHDMLPHLHTIYNDVILLNVLSEV